MSLQRYNNKISSSIFILIIQLSLCRDYACDAPRECIGKSLTGGSIYSRGYSANSGANSSMNCTSGICECAGTFGCGSISSIKSQYIIECDGDHACHKADVLSSKVEVDCDGLYSCSSTMITSPASSGNFLTCDADKACVNSHISGIQSISIRAAYALLNGTIDSDGVDDPLEVKLYGFHAGFGANIICKANSTCEITCAGNACSNLFVNCFGECIFHAEYAINPIQNLSLLNHSAIDLMYDSHQMSIEYEMECNQATSLTFDSDMQIFKQSLSNNTVVSAAGTICCRAYGSCYHEDGTTIYVESTSDTKYNLICSGRFSCYESDIHNYFGFVFCSAENSCKTSWINSSLPLYCLGRQSCYKSNIHNTDRLICSGHQSCEISVIYSSGLAKKHNFYFLGYNAGKQAVVHCHAKDECVVFCGGKTSCSGSSIICDTGCIFSVQCDEDSDCPNVMTTEPIIYSLATNETEYIGSTLSISSSIEPTVENAKQRSYMKESDVIAAILLIACVIITPLILSVFALRFHGKRTGSDPPGYLSLIRFFAGIADWYTDVLWSYSLFVEGHSLSSSAFIFVFGSHFVSIVVCIYWITKWRQNKHNIHVAEYANRYDKFVICLSVVSGFYGAVALITSHLFHLRMLSLCLDNEHLSKISTIKIFNTSLLENIPALIIQILYLKSIHLSNTDFITLLAMLFTIISILAMMFTLVERLINCVMDRAAAKTECALNEIRMEFMLQSEDKHTIKSYHIHTHYLMANAMSTAFQIEMSQIKIRRIQKISQGIKVNATLIRLKDDVARNIMNGLNENKLCSLLLNDCTDRLGIRLGLITLDIVHIELKRENNDDTDQRMMLQNVEMREIDWNAIDCDTVCTE